jgi:transitional endoplasmic reticulum ATPase
LPEKTIKLKVAEALPRDVGKNRARIHSQLLRRLSAKPGDVIKIRGKKVTVLTVWPSDGEKGIIRLDGIARRNAGVALNDHVLVSKVRPKEARSIVLSPLTTAIKTDEEFTSFVKNRIKDVPVVEGNTISIVVMGNPLDFMVKSTIPKGAVIIGDITEVKIIPLGEEVRIAEARVTYEDVGGLKEQLQRLREIVELPLRYPELFRKLGIEPPKGVLLYGPPGCGKTLIAKALANESQASFYAINGPEIMSKYYGETEAKLREIFREAKENAPSIIFIDEIDSIAPKREEVYGEVEKRVVAQLLSLMDGLTERGDVVVIGATNRIDDVDPALRRPGRFDREVEIGVPNTDERYEILQIHTRGMPLDKKVSLEKLAEITSGYTGADLKALCREAALNALRRILPHFSEEKGIPTSVLERLKITEEDFLAAYKEIIPTALREFYVETPKVRWEDIGGLEDVKRRLEDNILKTIKKPELFRKLGIEPPKGVLLYGPPGCGKTLIAKALANESQASFIVVRGPEILSKWVGESEKAIRNIFRKAKASAPSIILFDEIDALGKTRTSSEEGWNPESVLSQLLSEMDSLYTMEHVFVIGTTNRPDLLDPSLLRPGRFDMLVYIPPPDEEARLKILRIFTRNMPLAEDVSLEEIARATDRFTGADLKSLCREAGLLAMKEGRDKVMMKDFMAALRQVHPTFTPTLERWYESIKENIQSKMMGKGPKTLYG